MPLANVNALGTSRPAGDLLADHARHQAITGRGNASTTEGATTFMRQWPHPQDWAAQPLACRLGEGPQTTSFLMVHGWLQSGYDYLVSRKLSSFWREITASPLEADMARFRGGAEAIGYTPIQSLRSPSGACSSRPTYVSRT